MLFELSINTPPVKLETFLTILKLRIQKSPKITSVLVVFFAPKLTAQSSIKNILFFLNLEMKFLTLKYLYLGHLNE